MPALIDTYAQFPLDIVSGCGSRLRDRGGRRILGFLRRARGGLARPFASGRRPGDRGTGRRVDVLLKRPALDVRTRAAERLAAFAPPGLSHVFFCNSGAEANENAHQARRSGTPRRTRIASLVGGWHGRTLLCLAATDDPKITTPFARLLCDAIRLRPNECGDVEKIDDTIAAVILEPIQSIAGIVELGGDFLRALRGGATKPARC